MCRTSEKKLESNGLKLENDIVCIVTDGASVMKKVGQLISTEQQLCYAHGVQLAVLDVLYKGKGLQPQQDASSELDVQTEAPAEGLVNEDGNDEQDLPEGSLELDMTCETEEIDESLYADSFHVQAVPVPDDDFDLIRNLPAHYQQTVQCARKVVKMFKRSPTKNDEKLQPYVVSECGHEVHLKLDCKTRWNSLVDMLGTFLRLRVPIQKALIDLKEPSIVTDADFEKMQDIVSALEPVRILVEALCRRDTTLLSADGAIKFCIDTLQKARSKLAMAVAAALRVRTKERRYLAGILQYLHNPNATTNDDVFTVSSAPVVRKAVLSLIQRLDRSSASGDASSKCGSAPSASQGTPDDADSGSTSAAQQQSEHEPNDEVTPQTLKDKMNVAMQQSMMAPVTVGGASTMDKSLLNAIKAEMALHESTGSRGRCLETVYSYLLTIPPTSVEAERAFSAAGVFNTQLRSRLSDDSIDTLCFLRAYYSRIHHHH